jgi:hypothetical protein
MVDRLIMFVFGWLVGNMTGCFIMAIATVGKYHDPNVREVENGDSGENSGIKEKSGDTGTDPENF